MALEIKGPLQLEEFLADKPTQWSRLIAARGALRVLPVALSDLWEEHWLPVFRACLLSWAAGKYPAHNMTAAARSAADSAQSAADSAAVSAPRYSTSSAARPAAGSAARSAAFSARSAADSARSAARSAADSARSAARSAASSASRSLVWNAISSDVSELYARKTPESFSIVALLSLWPGKAPSSAADAWQRVTGKKTESHFAPWINWYQALLTGNGPSADYFGPDLTLRIAQQPDEWWNRHAREVNAEIAAWLEAGRNKADDNNKDESLNKRIEQLPEPGPAPVDFTRTPAGRLHADPVKSDQPDKAAQTYLNGLRDKLGKLLPELLGRNSDPFVIETLQDLQKFLPTVAAEADPFHIDLSRLTVESIGESYNNAAAEAELFPGAVARIVDVARTTLRFCQCFPKFRETESDGKGMGITTIQVAEMSPVAESAVKGLENADALDASAKAAFAETLEQLKSARTETAKRDLLARLLQMLRNAMLTLLKAAKEPATTIAEELKSLGRDSYKEVRPKLVKIGGTLILGTVLTAVGYTTVPLTRLADQLPQFKEIADIVKSLKDLAKP